MTSRPTVWQRVRSAPLAVAGIALLALAWFLPWVWGAPTLAILHLDDDGEPIPDRGGTLLELGATVPDSGHTGFAAPLVLVPALVTLVLVLVLRGSRALARVTAVVAVGCAVVFAVLPRTLVPEVVSIGGWVATAGALVVAVAAVRAVLAPSRGTPRIEPAAAAHA